jgi:hypothetical protein
VRVVAERDQEGGGGIGSDAINAAQRRAGVGGQVIDVGVERFGFGLELVAALCQ